MKIPNLSISEYLEFSDNEIVKILEREKSKTNFSKGVLDELETVVKKEIEIVA